MKIVDLPIDKIVPAPWNPNEMDQRMRDRLRCSLQQFGLVVPLVVRPVGKDAFETIGGAQRLREAKELGWTAVPCVIVEADDAHARLLAQALNHIAGQDNPGLRGQVLRDVLEAVPEEEVLALLPDGVDELRTLCNLSEETIAEHLARWEQQQAARLHHLQLQLTQHQLQVVERALRQATAEAKRLRFASPNLRGTALFVICQHFLRRQGGPQ